MIAGVDCGFLIAVLTYIQLMVPVQSTPECSYGSAPSPKPLTAFTSLPQDLQSPGYPAQYPTHTTCLWEITAVTGVVKVTFSHFDLEESLLCSRDFLEVSDKSSGSERLVGKYCGSVAPIVIYSTGSALTLRFVSEGFNAVNKGFVLHYQAVPEEKASSFCSPPKGNERLQNTGSSGEFYSPNYPVTYPAHIVCTWVLTVPKGKSVKLTFLDFDLKGDQPQANGTSCDHAQDYIEVRDGQSYTSPQKDRFCGDSTYEKNLPPVQITEGRYMWVRFQASNRTKRKWRGFRAQFQAVDLDLLFAPGVCSPSAPDFINNNLKLNSTSGTLTSPNFPSRYPPGMICTWVITVPAGKRVELTFDTFITEKSHHSCDADSDYVEFRDGEGPQSTKIRSSCGTQIPPVVHSSDRYLWVRFVSNANRVTLGGFKASYRAVDKESIVGILVGVVLGAVFVLIVAIFLACCIKKRRHSRPGASRPSSNPRQRRQLLPKPENLPRSLRGLSRQPRPGGYVPSGGEGSYPLEAPPPYSEGEPPPYTESSPPPQARQWPSAGGPSLTMGTTNSTDF